MSSLVRQGVRSAGKKLATTTSTAGRLAHTEVVKASDFSVQRDSDSRSVFQSTDDPLYHQIISDMKVPKTKKRLDKDMTSYFSSPQDNVPKRANDGMAAKIWMLFEACLVSELPRAFHLMKAIQSEAPHTIDEAVAQYMHAFCSDPKHSREDVEETVKSIKSSFPSYYHNAHAYAVHVRALMDRNAPMKHCDDVLSSFNGDIRAIFGFPDVIGASNILALVEHNRSYIKFFPSDDQPFLKQALASVKKEGELDERREAKAVKVTANDSSSLPELTPVSSANLTFIKNSLEALHIEEPEEFMNDLMAQLTSEDEVPFMMDKDSKINFFEFRKRLPNDEAREKFDDLLEFYNQKREQSLELRVLENSQRKWKHNYDQLVSANAAVPKELGSYLWEWHTKLVPLIRKEIEEYHRVISDDSLEFNRRIYGATEEERLQRSFGPFLSLLKPEKLATIVILEMVKMTAGAALEKGVHTSRAVISVGRAVELEFRSEQLLKLLEPQGFNINKRSQEFKKLITKNMKKVIRRLRSSGKDVGNSDNLFWTQEIRAQVGSALITPLIEVAKIVVEGKDPLTQEVKKGVIPAFYHTYEYNGGTKVGLIRCHSQITDSLSQERIKEAVSPQNLPMLVEPRPWTSYATGGYHFSTSAILRTKNSQEQFAYIRAASKRGDLDKVFQGLNVLGSTQWTPNKKILDVVTKIWNTGDEFLDIPALRNELVLPEPPIKPDGSALDPNEIRELRDKRVQAANEFAANRSMRCDLNYRLEIARGFLGERIYFPHSLDFRGRTYPLSPHFNHLGNDLSRGLLVFWKGRKLGDSGLRWLKIHLANMFGLDKVPLSEREAFAEQNMHNITNSAKDPLGGERWWMQADKPWQALATCFELYEAHNLPDPREYISHQPVHQDGTCNGLQHYAALGGDYEGAAQVNLIPADRPMDIYTHVARLVKERLEKETEEGNEDAKLLKDIVSRKVVKQTVMTNVYGVTYRGATAQIAKRLEDLKFSKDEASKYSTFLATRVFDTIRQLFHGAHLIQDWLAASADRISKLVRVDLGEDEVVSNNTCRSSVIWTSPLGLPIVQPYRQLKKKQVETNLPTVYITDPYQIHEVDRRKQVAAFPPNFVHSLDATHMLRTAISCGERGLSFASVHDSFWTHAADVDEMNEVIREEFAKLHDENLIARLKKEFEVRYDGFVYTETIPAVSPLGKKIKALREQLSKELGRPCNMDDEINLERKRRELLRNNDPKVRESAKSWVTTIQLAADEEVIPVKKGGMKIWVPFRLDDIPPRGDFKASEVIKSQYFFS